MYIMITAVLFYFTPSAIFIQSTFPLNLLTVNKLQHRPKAKQAEQAEHHLWAIFCQVKLAKHQRAGSNTFIHNNYYKKIKQKFVCTISEILGARALR